MINILNSHDIIGNAVEQYDQYYKRHLLHELYPDESMESRIWRAYFDGWFAGRMDLSLRYNIIDDSGEL